MYFIYLAHYLHNKRMMKQVLFIILLFAGFLLAQNQERVRQELEKTDELIKQAKEVVETVNNPDAQAVLNQAVEIQNSAWDGYRRRRFRWAYSRTLAARQKAREATEMVRNAPERIRAEIRRTAEVMNEATPRIIRANEPRALELLKMAQKEQSAAQGYLHQRRFRLALRFTFAARNHLYEALTRAKRLTAPELVKEEIDRTQGLIAKIQEEIQESHNLRAQEMFAKAGEWQVKAQNRFRLRLFAQALKFTLASRDLMFRAREIMTSEIDATLVQLALDETDHLLASWSEKILAEGESEAMRLLQEATKHQNTGRELFAADSLDKALLETTQARRLLNRAIELLHIEEPASERE